MKKFLSAFRRITSSGNYIPEIDGLRFLAIFSVLMVHIRGCFVDFSANHGGYTKKISDFGVDRLFSNGSQGVQLFFAISGFILAVPFIKQYRYNQKKIKLKSFYLRRLTRLEPPYIIALIILFFGDILSHQYSFKELLPSLVASIFYSHNIIYQQLPKVTTVAWSLEVEVQFYLLMPLLMRMYLLSQQKTRLLLLLVIIIFPFLQNIFPTHITSLYKYFQFFAAGILLADLYLDKESIAYKCDNTIFSVVGILLLFLLFWLNAGVRVTLPSNVPKPQFYIKAIYPFIIIAFFIIVLINFHWRRIVSFKIITVIGGMCYSIYLLHTAIIAIFKQYVFKLAVTKNSLVDYLISLFVLCIIVIVIAGIYFLFIEKPCMQRDWYKKFFFKRFKKREKTYWVAEK